MADREDDRWTLVDTRLSGLERGLAEVSADRVALWAELHENSRITRTTQGDVAAIKARQDGLPEDTARAVNDMLAARRAVRFAAFGLGTGALSALGASVWHWVAKFWEA